MFYREVSLPQEIPGRLLISRLPGRDGTFHGDRSEIVEAGIDTVVSMISLDEIDLEAEEYAEAIRTASTPWEEVILPLPEASPAERKAFLQEMESLARHLRGGGKVLVHCAAGSGRTGTAALCVLMVLGVDPATATRLVARHGAGPQTSQQRALVEWAASAI